MHEITPNGVFDITNIPKIGTWDNRIQIPILPTLYGDFKALDGFMLLHRNFVMLL